MCDCHAPFLCLLALVGILLCRNLLYKQTKQERSCLRLDSDCGQQFWLVVIAFLLAKAARWCIVSCKAGNSLVEGL